MIGVRSGTARCRSSDSRCGQFERTTLLLEGEHLRPDAYVRVCPECADVNSAPHRAAGSQIADSECGNCGEVLDWRTEVWTGRTEYPAQQDAAQQEIERRREIARRFPTSTLAASLERSLADATHYEVLELPITATSKDVERRARYHYGEIPVVMAHSLWRSAEGQGFTISTPTRQEDEVYGERWRRAVAVLNDPSQRAAYDLTVTDQASLVASVSQTGHWSTDWGMVLALLVVLVLFAVLPDGGFVLGAVTLVLLGPVGWLGWRHADRVVSELIVTFRFGGKRDTLPRRLASAAFTVYMIAGVAVFITLAALLPS